MARTGRNSSTKLRSTSLPPSESLLALLVLFIMMRLLVFSFLVSTVVAFRLPVSGLGKSALKLSMVDPDSLNHIVTHLQHSHHLDFSSFYTAADAVVSPYSKVDKTGPIGFIATYIEGAIDLFKDLLNGVGIKNGYGFSIVIFTILSKFLRLLFSLLFLITSLILPLSCTSSQSKPGPCH